MLVQSILSASVRCDSMTCRMVQQVIVLEQCAMDERPRTRTGQLLAGRLRYFDALHVNSVKLDKQQARGKVFGFLEATCKRKKTMTSLESRMRLLPVAVLLESWVETWLALRDWIGLVVNDKYPFLTMANGQ